MQGFVIGRSRLVQTAILYGLTFAAVALLAIVLAYWTWVWFAPRVETRLEDATVQGGNVASARAIFGNARREQPAAATGIAIRLLGVAAASGNRRGYAVVQLEAKDIRAVPEGEEIAPGIRLAEVRPGHVILERGGVRETLAWPKRATTPAPIVRPSAK